MKQFNIISIFPNALNSYFNESILKRAQSAKLIKIQTHDLRKYSTDRHHKVDDRVYGGGAGMVLKVEPVYKALKSLRALNFKFQISNFKSNSKSQFASRRVKFQKIRVILLAANGKQFTQSDAVRLSKYDRLVFICGRYEGVDARVEKFVHEKISIGPYVVTGGELPAAMIIDAVSRMIPGVVGKEESIQNESFSQVVIKLENNLDLKPGSHKVRKKNFLTSSLHDSMTYLEHPHYTRPEVFVADGKKYKVPKVLLGGNHKEIEDWRKEKSSK
ncbi:MAG: tRNA (guanine(37)-N(1))-methyltransferase [Patescibacteria group bacterium]